MAPVTNVPSKAILTETAVPAITPRTDFFAIFCGCFGSRATTTSRPDTPVSLPQISSTVTQETANPLACKLRRELSSATIGPDSPAMPTTAVLPENPPTPTEGRPIFATVSEETTGSGEQNNLAGIDPASISIPIPTCLRTALESSFGSPIPERRGSFFPI